MQLDEQALYPLKDVLALAQGCVERPCKISTGWCKNALWLCALAFLCLNKRLLIMKEAQAPFRQAEPNACGGEEHPQRRHLLRFVSVCKAI